MVFVVCVFAFAGAPIPPIFVSLSLNAIGASLVSSSHGVFHEIVVLFMVECRCQEKAENARGSGIYQDRIAIWFFSPPPPFTNTHTERQHHWHNDEKWQHT